MASVWQISVLLWPCYKPQSFIEKIHWTFPLRLDAVHVVTMVLMYPRMTDAVLIQMLNSSPCPTSLTRPSWWRTQCTLMPAPNMWYLFKNPHVGFHLKNISMRSYKLVMCRMHSISTWYFKKINKKYLIKFKLKSSYPLKF